MKKISISLLSRLVLATSRLARISFLLLIYLLMPREAVAQDSPVNDIFSDTWVATDALGRTLPNAEELPGVQKKYVGVFYYLKSSPTSVKTNKGKKTDAIYDIDKIIAANPGVHHTKLPYGPKMAYHWWGEPEAGYYKPQDPWVIRRNLQMLAVAGVDFIFFDASNARWYKPTVLAISEVALTMRKEGIQVPSFTFLTRKGGGKFVNGIHQQYYLAHPEYRELWFKWKGKPLLFVDEIIMSGKDSVLSAAAAKYFTFRYSWAWSASASKPRHWQWLDSYKQDYGWDTDRSMPEQISVSVASHPSNLIGGSYSKGSLPKLDASYRTAHTGKGLHFEEQWSRVHRMKKQPQVVMISQWNEWTQKRMTVTEGAKKKFLGDTVPAGGTFFVDVFNQEFNRDIAPMLAGHTDNRYYQMVGHIRRFKGVRSPQAAGSAQTLSMDGLFDDWKNITPHYQDYAGDTAHRKWLRSDNAVTYKNNSGRNDIIASKVAYDGDHLYFMAKTQTKITSHTDPNWMLLFIDSDQNKSTGWEGYDYALNMNVVKSNLTTVSKFSGGKWISVGKAKLAYAGDQLEIRVSRNLLAQTGDTIDFDFHWADNIKKRNDISEFFLNGDSAPDRRFNYRFSTQKSQK
jgi:hypothetical protein